MNKKKIGIIALIIVMLSGVMMIFANGIKNKQVVEKHDGKLQIVVTSFPQYDLLGQLLEITRIYKCLLNLV